MNCISVENGDLPTTALKGLIESANCAGSVANAKTLCCILYRVSWCMIPCFHENTTLKRVQFAFVCHTTIPCFLAITISNRMFSNCFYWCIRIHRILQSYSRQNKIDVEVYCKQCIVQKLVLNTVPHFQKVV